MLRWLERNGYDVTYTTGVDSDRRGNLIQNHDVFLSVGPRRVLVGRAARQRRGGARRRREPRVLQRERGVLEDALGAEHRRHEHRPPDARLLQGDARQRADRPGRPADVDRHLARPAVQPARRRRPPGERAHRHPLHGQRPIATIAIAVPAADGKLRFWRNTSIATPRTGRRPATLPTGTLGYEWDVDVDNGSRPPGLIDMSSTTLDVSPTCCSTTARRTATEPRPTT